MEQPAESSVNPVAALPTSEPAAPPQSSSDDGDGAGGSGGGGGDGGGGSEDLRSSSVGKRLAAAPCVSLASAGGLMLFVALLGPTVAPLQFDASVNGFVPRGTPMALRINTGIMLQKGLSDDTLHGFPAADCGSPPVELWLALCGSQASDDVDTSTIFAPAAAVGGLLERLSGKCSPICMATVAPWYRECREQQPLDELADVVSSVITEKLPVTAQTALTLLFATNRGQCRSLAACVSGMLQTCDATMAASILENQRKVGAGPADSGGGAGASDSEREFCHQLHGSDIDGLDLGIYYEPVDEDGGDLLSATSLHEVCEFEARVLEYAGEQGYCQTREMNQLVEGGSCCPAQSYAQMLVWLLDKDCASITDDDIQQAVSLVRTCDAAESESCVPGWLGSSCAADGDCVAADPSCRSSIAKCKQRRCVSRCETAGEGGMLAPLIDEGDTLSDRIGGTVYSHLIYEFFDSDFAATGRLKLSKARFPFISAVHRNGEDMSQVVSKQQLLPLYNDVLAEAATPAAGKTVKVLSYEGVLMMDIVNQILVSDVLHVVGALLVVFLAMVFHTGSLFISALGMLHVVMAFPAAYTTYRLLFGIKWMSLLNYIGIFVAVGIGADDIFVYTDAWRQGAVMLPPDTPLDVRITWTLRRAGSAMLVTSFTTCAAFATNYVNNVVPMQLFGIFMALMVFWDYIFTVTWFPCVVAVYHVHIEPRYGSNHPFHACIPNRRRSEDMSDKSESLTAGTMGEHSGDKAADGGETGGVAMTAVAAQGKQQGQVIELWFRDTVAPFVFEFKKPIVAGILFVTIPLAVCALSMPLDEGGIQAFPLWHDQRQYMILDNHPHEHFRERPSSHWRGTIVQMAFGIVASDSGDRFDPDDQGELVFDDSFNTDDAAAQLWLLDTMVAARDQPFAMPGFIYPRAEVTSASGLTADGRRCAGQSTLELALDSKIGSFWVMNDCEVGQDGTTVVVLRVLSADDENLELCKLYPAYCLLLGPKLVDRVDITWASGQAATAYRVEGALYPDQWETLANVDGLSVDRPPNDSIAVGWKSFSFIRLSFRGQNMAIAEISCWGDDPSVVEIVHSISSALPEGSMCAGGLPLPNFAECAGQLARLATNPLTGNVTGLPGALFYNEGALKGVVARFHTTVGQGVVASWEYHKVHPNFLEWEGFIAERLELAPASCATAWTASMAFMAAETQASLQTACWRAGMLSLVIAFGVLMASTRNLTVSLLATGAIATILFWTVGIVVAMGWELGIMESMDIAILIGISCDAVVHFSHAYCECTVDGQQERMTHALHVRSQAIRTTT